MRASALQPAGAALLPNNNKKLGLIRLQTGKKGPEVMPQAPAVYICPDI